MFGESGLPVTGFALVTLAYAAFAISLAGRQPSSAHSERSARWLVAAVLLTAAWGLASLADLWSAKQLSWHVAQFFDQSRYAAWLGFLLLLLGSVRGGGPAALPARASAAWPALALLMVAGLAVNIWSGVTTADRRWVFQLVGASHLAWAVTGLLLVEQVFRNQADAARWAAKPLCLGLGGLFVFDVYLYAQVLMFGAIDEDAAAARALVHSLAVPLLLIASRRHRQWLSKLQVSQTAAFYSMSLLLIGVYLLLIAGAGYYIRYFGGSWGGALQVAILFGALLLLALLMLSGALRARLRVFLGKHFFRYRYDYRREWLRFTRMLSTKVSPHQVGELVVRGLADMVECSAGSLWYRALGDDRHVQSSVWNLPVSAHAEATDSQLCRFMAEQGWIIDLSECRSDPALAAAQGVPSALLAIESAWLLVPLMVDDRLNGFVLLARPRTEVDLNWEVRDLLKTAARQAAGFLAHMHATEALLEARKFDAFNRMSAFVVHDLKNIITQLSLMMKNAERHRDNPEFQQDMLTTVESSLDKMRQMMLQLREGERPLGSVSGVELQALLKRIADQARQRGRRIELEIVDRVATRGHEQRLERVLGHLVQNSLDATPVDGRVWVRLQQSVGRAMVTIGDTGSGMSRDFIQTRLFRPFSSTKSHGMGIGSYESYQYIKELGGSLDVTSEVDAGTVVTVLLPLLDLRLGSDLRVESVG